MTAHLLLSRERFVENALCMGLGLATRGAHVYPPCSSLEAGRMIAADLKQFGFQWPDLELHLAQTGGSSAGTALTSSQCTDARTIATSPDKQGERP